MLSMENMSCLKFRPDHSPSQICTINGWFLLFFFCRNKRLIWQGKFSPHSKRTCYMMKAWISDKLPHWNLYFQVLHIIYGNHQLLASKPLKRNETQLNELNTIYWRKAAWHTPRESIASFILLKSIFSALFGANQGSPLFCNRGNPMSIILKH